MLALFIRQISLALPYVWGQVFLGGWKRRENVPPVPKETKYVSKKTATTASSHCSLRHYDDCCWIGGGGQQGFLGTLSEDDLMRARPGSKVKFPGVVRWAGIVQRVWSTARSTGISWETLRNAGSWYPGCHFVSSCSGQYSMSYLSIQHFYKNRPCVRRFCTTAG